MKPHDKKTFVIVDLDDTLIKGQSQRYFLEFLFKKKIVTLSYYIRILFWFLLYKFHLTNNPTDVMNYAYRAIRGKTEGEVKNLIDGFFVQYIQPNIYDTILDKLRSSKTRGSCLVIVSNSTEIIVKSVAEHIGADFYIATKLKKENGIYTGKIINPIMYGEAKLGALKTYFETHNIKEAAIEVYADHLSDLPLFEYADKQYVVNPKHKLAYIAQQRGWGIIKQE